MIRLIREGSRKYPWILLGIIGVIVVTFVIGMGWFGYGEVQRDKIATVGDLKISRDEYERAYRRSQNFYRENKQEVEAEQLKTMVVDDLIKIKVWTLAAEAMALTITPDELRAEQHLHTVVIRHERHAVRGQELFDQVLRRALGVGELVLRLHTAAAVDDDGEVHGQPVGGRDAVPFLAGDGEFEEKPAVGALQQMGVAELRVQRDHIPDHGAGPRGPIRWWGRGSVDGGNPDGGIDQDGEAEQGGRGDGEQQKASHRTSSRRGWRLGVVL